MASTLLGGCAVPNTKVARNVTFVVGTDENAFVKGSLDDTINAFTGGSGGSAHPVGQIPSDFLDSASGGAVPYRQPRSTLIGGRVSWQKPVTPHTAWLASAQGSFGASDYLLPKGAGILVQPIAITFRTTSLDLAGGMRHTIREGRMFDLDVEGKAGVLLVQTRTRINSPVLAVRHTDRQSLKYGSVALAARPHLRRPNAPAPVGRVELRAYPTIGARLSAEIGLEF